MVLSGLSIFLTSIDWACRGISGREGNDIDYVPNKRGGGVVLGGNIAPIFFNTAQDSGALPIECDVSKMCGQKI
jgi:aconitate hydratase 2/2-methylisocitrate dehydratase